MINNTEFFDDPKPPIPSTQTLPFHKCTRSDAIQTKRYP